MKKAYLFLIALGLVAFVACNKGAKEGEEAADTTAVEAVEPVVEEPVAVDTAAVTTPAPETPAPTK